MSFWKNEAAAAQCRWEKNKESVAAAAAAAASKTLSEETQRAANWMKR